MRTNALMVIVAPIAGWAVFASLSLMGVGPVFAGLAGLLWGLAWLVAVRLLPDVHRHSWHHDDRAERHAEASRRRYLVSAIMSTASMPIPAFAFAFLLQRFDLLPATIGLPMVVVLGAPVPVVLWRMAVRPRYAFINGPIMAVAWQRYEPAVSAARIPPRNSTLLRLQGISTDDRRRAIRESRTARNAR